MARYKYIQRNHAIVIPATQVPATTKTANPWLTSTTTSGTTTTEVETTTPAPTSQTTRVETLYEFLARIRILLLNGLLMKQMKFML